jgi:tetratricopeptide (TPR) repeat protein
MISSTARALPEHREKVMHACMRMGMFYPEMMEHLSAADANAVEVSLRMVEKADLYLGIFGPRYGSVPLGSNISITEMEYNRAVERGIPRLIFLMHDDHPVKQGDVETGEGAQKLKALKERLKTDRVVGFFKSPDELLALIIQSLSEIRQPDLTAFHYVSDIPAPPESFVAHPYTLLQTHTLIGRQKELKLLTDWITSKELEFDGQKAPADSVRIMSVVAVGGMGKSALTWKWFNEVAPQEMKNLAGRMWWSFYESDATFENFVIRTLAYVSERTIDEVTQIPAPERETQLLAALDREPFLLVLDGSERILIAYARMDAARLDDSEVGKEKNLRKTADPRVGSFLKKLAQVKRSRVLVSSRLYPAELETSGGDPIPATFRIKIEGLADEDAVELWRAFGVSGSRDELLPVFSAFAKHPLLIQALAGEVKRYRKAPGDFDEWCKANPKFDPTKLPELTKAMGHVLEFALRRLDGRTRHLLFTISAFRMPATYDTLTALLVGKKKTRYILSTNELVTEEGKLFEEERDLDAALSELEDRGLLGWDKRANRYDVHPIVRGVVWEGMAEEARRGVYSNLHSHFEAVPMIEDYREVNSLEDLTPAIELYNTLIGLRRYDDAATLFFKRLNKAALFRLSVGRPRVELLEMLFPDGLERLPSLNTESLKAYALNALAVGYKVGGQPRRAAVLYRRAGVFFSGGNLSGVLANLSSTLRSSGAPREAETTACRSVVIARHLDKGLHEAASLYSLGLSMAARGRLNESWAALHRSLRIFITNSHVQFEGVVNSYIAQRAMWLGDFAQALSFANRAWELAHVHRYERDFIRAARVQGEAALGLKDIAAADERLHHALTRARIVNLVEEELPALVALAELRCSEGDPKAAREYLDDVWELAERGPYPLFHADACNVLAQIERDEGNRSAAIEAATKAYRLAWRDGPPFAYHWGLEKAKKHLKELGATEPEMPPFDESKFEPMPEVEINPRDEFYVDEESLNEPPQAET